MTTLESRIGALFLTGNVNTTFTLFEDVYQFLFVENIVYGIVVTVIVVNLLFFLFKKLSNSSNKDIEFRKDLNLESAINRDGSLDRTSNNNSKNTTTKDTDYSTDLELVAVITAAIMAYMGEDAPEDGLIIRSIRKVNRRNHVNNYSD